MGQYQGYEKYKDSGVEWLGEIPEHWETSQLGYLATIKARLGWKGLTASEYIDDGYIFLATPNIKHEGWIDFENVNYISAERYFESPEIMLQEKDVLLAKDGSTLGIVNIVRQLPSPSTVNSSIAVIRVIEKINSEFLYHWLRSSYIQSVIQLMKGGQGVPHLFQSDIKRFNVIIPPLEEQNTIAQFLDYKTSQIDALIAKKEALLEKLDEKRTALISHAVTKGLDPTVPMKDSGVEWLGEIPAHWEAVKGKFIFNILSGYAPADFIFEDEGLNYYQVDDLNNDSDIFSLSESSKHIQQVKTCWIIQAPFILFPKRGAAIATNKVKIVTNDSIFDTHLMGLKVNLIYSTNFIAYVILSRGLWDIADVSTIPQINNKHINPLSFPLPPPDEQEKIVQYLDHKTSEIDQQKSKIQQAIDLLKEYRTALITNAVTGKIDIRQVPIPQP